MRNASRPVTRRFAIAAGNMLGSSSLASKADGASKQAQTNMDPRNARSNNGVPSLSA